MNIRPAALSVNTLSIPDDLKALPRWVLWRYTKKKKPNGEFVWSKVPFTTANAYASSTNEATWCTFDEAADALLMGDYDGLGIVLGGDLHGIDLDDCRDPKTGELNDFAKEVVERVHGYAEISPSGTGLKIFCNTNLDGRVKVMFALTSIKGVGRRFSNIACKKAEVDLNKRCADRPLRLAGRRESRRDRDACLSRLKSPDGCRTPPRRARGLQAAAPQTVASC